MTLQPESLVGAEIKTPEPRKLEVLWLSDTPACATGFGQVARNLLTALQATGKYNFTIIGINQSDWYDQSVYPWKILEAMPARPKDIRHQDVFGRQRFLDELSSGKYDLVFTLQDTFILEPISQKIFDAHTEMREANAKAGQELYRPFKWIYYFPIDARPKANWITKSVILADFPICYTNWGKQECLDAVAPDLDEKIRKDQLAKVNTKIRVIYHGSNTKEFFPIPDDQKESLAEFRKAFFQGKADGKFLVVNVNRNQPRKDLVKTLAAWDKFVQLRPDSYLYLHCKRRDVGGDLLEYARNFKHLKLGENWTMPMDFDESEGVPISTLNMIYNAADLVVSTTKGEGWGLSYTEAMATKTLLMVPDNTSAPEIVGKDEERGLLIKCGDHSGSWEAMREDNERLRPLVNVDHMVERLVWVYDNLNSEEVQTKIDLAYAWVQEHQWTGKNIGDKWLQVFEEASLSLEKERIGESDVPIGRNDPCPCGSGKKYKKCHGQ